MKSKKQAGKRQEIDRRMELQWGREDSFGSFYSEEREVYERINKRKGA